MSPDSDWRDGFRLGLVFGLAVAALYVATRKPRRRTVRPVPVMVFPADRPPFIQAPADA